MPQTLPAAFPYIQVNINTAGLVPTAQRLPGVIAIVGETPAGADGGTALVNRPEEVASIAHAAQLFAKVSNAGVVTPTTLYESLRLAMLQDPKPSKVYGVRVTAGNHAEGLAALDGVDDITFVALAGVTAIGTANPPTGLLALKAHVETASADGNKRIGVAMIDPAVARSTTYVADMTTAIKPLQSGNGRMLMLAARGATGDAAAATMAAVAAYQPHISMVLKQVKGFAIPAHEQYTPTEITQLSAAGLNAIIDPALIVGESLHLADGKLYSSDAALGFVDVVRTLDDIDFRLKAGLIGLVGDARITAGGLIRVKARIEGILGRLRRAGVIDGFSITIPVLTLLSLPEAAWDTTDREMVRTARETRTVEVDLQVVYGPAVHRLAVTLSPSFT